MKTQITSVDICFLARELNGELSSGRFDKAYQLGKKELKLKAYVSGKGSREVVIAPNYLSMTSFPRKAPEQPSSFAMQLRKNLNNAYIREVLQHDFDRIIEITIEKEGKKFFLIAEFFSRGNVLFCDGNRKILGLLEWQRWKDRKLGVGQTYEYPPETTNPLKVDRSFLGEALSSSEKKMVSVLASDVGLGGLYAEEVCLLSGIEKDKVSKQLTSGEIDAVYGSLKSLAERIMKGESDPMIILEGEKYVDVIPFGLKVYEGSERKTFDSFNAAVDEYFSKAEFASQRRETDDKFQKELGKLKEIQAKQEEIISRFERESKEFKETGDRIYQNFQAIEEIAGYVKIERRKGVSWDAIKEKLEGKEYNGIKIAGVDKDGLISLEVGD